MPYNQGVNHSNAPLPESVRKRLIARNKAATGSIKLLHDTKKTLLKKLEKEQAAIRRPEEKLAAITKLQIAIENIDKEIDAMRERKAARTGELERKAALPNRINFFETMRVEVNDKRSEFHGFKGQIQQVFDQDMCLVFFNHSGETELFRDCQRQLKISR